MRNIWISKIKITNLNTEELLNLIKENIKNKKETHIITLNSIIFTKSLFNKNLKKLLKSADIIIPESEGIKLLLSISNKKIKEKINGIDLAKKLLDLAERENFSVFLLGGSKEVSLLAEKNVRATFKKLRLVGRYHGYFKDKKEEENIVLTIKKLSPDILFVAMGFPKQDIFISNYKDNLNSTIMIGVGGTFDIFSGKKIRAPSFFIKNKLEWFYRIITNPTKYYQIFLLLLFCIYILFTLIKRTFKSIKVFFYIKFIRDKRKKY